MFRFTALGLAVIISGSAATGCGTGHTMRTSSQTTPTAAPSPDTTSRVVLAGPLPPGPANSPAWTLPTGPADQASVDQLTRALGITGTPHRDGPGWKSSGPGVLQVTGDPGQPWSFLTQGAPTGAAPAQPAAQATARRFARTSGLAIGPFRATLSGRSIVFVADLTAGGLPTASWQTQLTIGAGGRITAAEGWLARPQRGTGYPVITAPQAFESLRKALASRPLPVRARCPEVEQEACPPGGRRQLVVTNARFGLSLTYWKNRPVLAPSWLFTTREGAVIPQVAVVPERLPVSPP